MASEEGKSDLMLPHNKLVQGEISLFLIFPKNTEHTYYSQLREGERAADSRKEGLNHNNKLVQGELNLSLLFPKYTEHKNQSTVTSEEEMATDRRKEGPNSRNNKLVQGEISVTRISKVR